MAGVLKGAEAKGGELGGAGANVEVEDVEGLRMREGVLSITTSKLEVDVDGLNNGGGGRSLLPGVLAEAFAADFFAVLPRRAFSRLVARGDGEGASKAESSSISSSGMSILSVLMFGVFFFPVVRSARGDDANAVGVPVFALAFAARIRRKGVIRFLETDACGARQCEHGVGSSSSRSAHSGQGGAGADMGAEMVAVVALGRGVDFGAAFGLGFGIGFSAGFVSEGGEIEGVSVVVVED